MKVVVTPKTTASYDFTNYQIETLLYTIEGYMQGNDDEKLVNELSDLFQILHDGLPVSYTHLTLPTTPYV